MKWYTISINPPEINKGQDLIFRRQIESTGKIDYSDPVMASMQSFFSDFEQMVDYCVVDQEMTHWAVLTDYNEGNNNE